MINNIFLVIEAILIIQYYRRTGGTFKNAFKVLKIIRELK